jgi:hypothetical protein
VQDSLWPDENAALEFELRANFPNVQYCLAHYADELSAAMKYRLFPRSARPGSSFKKLWFVSRALAAAHLKVKLTTALNLVSADRPEERALRRPRRSRKRGPVSFPAPAA